MFSKSLTKRFKVLVADLPSFTQKPGAAMLLDFAIHHSQRDI
jgi:hypothetical protein